MEQNLTQEEPWCLDEASVASSPSYQLWLRFLQPYHYGLVFTVFAIFQKDSQIGKVWLAGPTTMVVGLVLCGKVIIDWGPAMMHGREGSIDSRIMDQLTLTNSLPTGGNMLNGASNQLKAPLHFDNLLPPQQLGTKRQSSLIPVSSSLSSTHLTSKTPLISRGSAAMDEEAGQAGAIDCIVYAQYDSISNSNPDGSRALRPIEESTQTSQNSMYNHHLHYRPTSSPVATQTVITTDKFTQCSCDDYDDGLGMTPAGGQAMTPVQVFSARDRLASWVENNSFTHHKQQ
uniref:Uncharacterized protein n=1 Tax=Ditylenchus dipsaci TaxID=166011 RepID=A0A915E1A0_9BILA